MTAVGIAFGTLALGEEYRYLARMLARDLQTWHPDLPFVVLTDAPAEFRDLANVRPIQHVQRSIWHPFHDKRFVLSAGLVVAHTCVFLDADARLLGPVPLAPLRDLRQAVLVDRAMPMIDRHEAEIAAFVAAGRRDWPTPPPREWRLVQRAHERLGIRTEDTFFVREHLVAVARDDGRERTFAAVWAELARFFELRGFSFAEGNAIGMAARVTGWEVREVPATTTWLFKDIRTADARFPPDLAARIRQFRGMRQQVAATLHSRTPRPVRLWRSLLRLGTAVLRRSNEDGYRLGSSTREHP